MPTRTRLRGTSPSPSPASSPTAAAVQTTPTAQLPVDTTIAAVSLLDPSPEAAEALQICHVTENLGPDLVSGMGQIHHARDALRYAPLTGLEPEIKTDAPAWIVTFKGEVPMPMTGEIWVDPTCIVVGGDGGFFATGPVKILSSKVTVTPLPVKQQPDLALPPVLP
jgi:hypothetical protein